MPRMKKRLACVALAALSCCGAGAQDQTANRSLVESLAPAQSGVGHDHASHAGGIDFVYSIGTAILVEHSSDNGETFGAPVALGFGTTPLIATSGGVSCAAWIGASGEVSIAYSVNAWQTHQTIANVSTFAGNSGLRMRLVASVAHLVWRTSTAVYYRAVDLSLPIVSGESGVSSVAAGLGFVDIDVDATNVYVVWRRSTLVMANVKPHSASVWPTEVGIGSATGNTASSLGVAGVGGVGWFAWTAPSAFGVNYNVVQGRAWAGGAFSPTTVQIMATSPPTSAFSYKGVVAAAAGSTFHVACVLNTNSNGVFGNERERCVVASNAGSGWGSPVVVDGDPLPGFYSASDVRIECLASGGVNSACVVWRRTSGGQDTLRFAKSLDAGLSWAPTCPGCSVPVFVATAFGASISLTMDDRSVVASYFLGSSGVRGYYAHVVAGHIPYSVCSSAPVICGGSAGTSIVGSGTPWTSPVPTSPALTTSVIVSSTIPATFPMAVLTTVGRAISPVPMVLGIVPHVDLSSAIVQVAALGSSAQFDILIPDSSSSSFLGAKVFCQGAFLDPTLPTLLAGWTNGIEVRVN